MKETKEITPIDVVNKIEQLTDKRQSLAEFAAVARLTPVVLMEEAIARLEPEVVHSINQVHLSIYSALYLSVLNLQKTNKKGITAESIIEPLSDRRSVRSASFDVISSLAGPVATESFQSPFLRDTGSFMEDFVLESKDAGGAIDKPSSLAIGKVLNVPLGEGLPDMTVTVMLNPRVIDTAFLVRVLEAYVGKDRSVIGRWHQWRAGEISSFLDYALALDLIEEDRKLRADDKDGFYLAAKNSRLTGMLSQLLTGKKSLNVASNFVLFTKTGMENMERAMRGKFTSANVRQKFFETTGTMIASVVDPIRETVTIYTRGAMEYGIYGFDELKPAATNPSHPDINSIMKAYKEGAAFSL
jgi:hypothetical protein